jgi:TonB family protein
VQDENFCAPKPSRLSAPGATPFLVTSYRITCLAAKLPYPGQAGGSASERSLFAQKFLVAFENSQGLVYAQVSGWDQAYLLWTFRNFRSLPQNVLNLRQQQLMASLYRNAAGHSMRGLSDAFVVGRIEDFDPEKPVAVSISRKDGTSASSPPHKIVADVAVLDRDQRSRAPFSLGRMTLKIGAGALVAVIAVLAWHQLGAQPVSHSTASESRAASATATEPSSPTAKDSAPAAVASPAESVVAPSTLVTVNQTNPVPPVSAPMISALEMAAKPAVNISSANDKPRPSEVAALTTPAHTRAESSHRPSAPLPLALDAAADQPRIQISGRPRKLIYPICPETSSRGKVSLQAVVENDGKVSRVRVLTGDRALAKAAVEAVRQWRYEPASGADPKVERETNITVSFISNEVIAVSFPEVAPLSR